MKKTFTMVISNEIHFQTFNQIEIWEILNFSSKLSYYLQSLGQTMHIVDSPQISLDDSWML